MGQGENVPALSRTSRGYAVATGPNEPAWPMAPELGVRTVVKDVTAPRLAIDNEH